MSRSTINSKSETTPRKCGLATCRTRFTPNRPHHEYHSKRCRWIAFKERERERIRAEVLAEIKDSVTKQKENSLR